MVMKTLTSWLNSNTNTQKPRHRRTKTNAHTKLAMEHLETRDTPAAVFWDGGGGDTNWLNALNWSNDALPTLSDDVTIISATGGVDINNTFGTAQAGSLHSSNDLRVISGTLQLAGDSLVTGHFTLGGVTFGGVVTGTGTLTLAGDVAWGAHGVMAGSGKTVLQGTSTLEGETFGSIRENRVVENNGNATILAGQSFNFRDNAVLRNLAGGTLTFENGSGIGTFFASAASKVVNEGEMVVSGPNTATIGVLTENSGTFTSNAATLNLSGLNNSGLIDILSGDVVTGGANNSNSGIIHTSTGSRFVVNGGTTFLNAGAKITGDGAMLLQGGNLTASAPANIMRLEQTGGTITVNAPLTIGDYNFNGTVTGPDTLAVTGNMTWGSNGAMLGTGKTVLVGTSTLAGSTFGSIRENRVVENSGNATILAGQSFTFRDNAVFRNLADGILTFQNGASIGTFFASAPSKVVNEGELILSGPGTSTIGVLTENSGILTSNATTLNLTGLNNSGTVATTGNVNAGSIFTNTGSIVINSGVFNTGSSFTNSGSIDILSGDMVTSAANAHNSGAIDIGTSGRWLLNGGAMFLDAGNTITGAGLTVMQGASLTATAPASIPRLQQNNGTLNVNVPVTIGDYIFNGGGVAGPDTLTVTGNMTWAANAAMGGNGKTVLQGTSTLAGSTFGSITQNRIVENSGDATVLAGQSFTFRDNAVFRNLADGTLTFQAGAGIGNFFASASSKLVNEGEMIVNGPGTTSISVAVENPGHIEILSGDLSVANNSRHSGTANIGAAGRWLVNNGAVFFDEGASTSGPGVVLQAANLTVTGEADIARLQQNSGTLAVSAPLTIADYIFNSGTITGTGTTTLTGTSSFTGTGSRTINAHTINNAGTVIWSQTGGILFSGTTTFNNLAGSLFDITGDGAILLSGLSTPVFNNMGTVRKSGGAGTISSGPRTLWTVPLINNGVLEIQTGVLGFSGATSLTNAGTIQVGTASSSNAFLSLPGNAYTLAGGTLTGTGQVSNVSNLTIAPGATLGGTLTIVSGSVTNRGTVRPGTSPGALTITGNYIQIDDATADGKLVIGLRGDSSSGMFGKLQVNGTSQLSGALEVFADGGFLPDFGDVFQVFRSTGARTGDFTYPAGGYDLDGYRVLDHEYDSTGLRLNLTTEVGTLPIIDAIPDVEVNEGQTVNFTVTVSGAEAPGPLTFSLVDGSSLGATIDPNTGEFSFTPLDGPNTYVFQIAVHDPNAPTDPVDVETFVVTVRNVAPVVEIYDGQAERNEGQEFTASGSFTDPGADTWTATIDYGDGSGVQPLTLNADKTFALNHQYLDNGNYTITVRVFDGFEYGTTTFEVAVTNLAPAVVAAGNQSAVEGTEGTFAIGSFTDAGSLDQPWTVEVNWGDGSAPVIFETTTQGLLSPLAHTFANSGNFTVTVTVTDKDGGTHSDTFAVQVANVAPVAAVSGPSNGVRGQVRTFTLSATDVSSADQAAGFTFTINWGDGTTQTVSGLSGMTVEHIYTASGNYTVTTTATDANGAVSEAVTHAIAVSAIGVQNGVLVIGGTTGDDVITVTQGLSSGSYIVAMLSPTPDGSELTVAVVKPNTSGFDIDLTVGDVHIGLFTVPYAPPLTRVEVYAQAGDDNVLVGSGVSLASLLFGGDGNDWMKGGGGNSILDGGAGNDELYGGNGRDVLIGETGSDKVLGQNGDDLMIGGVFLNAKPSQEARRGALLNVMQTWTSSASFDDRVDELMPYLAPNVGDDGVSDQLNGGGGNDWYWARTTGSLSEKDKLNGVTSHDEVTTI